MVKDVWMEVRFDSLAAAWLEDIMFISSSTVIVSNPNYQAIIAMGPDVLPLIFESLENHHYHWFWALHMITGENPVAEEDAGRVGRMAEVWLQWGRDHGITW